MNRSIKFFLPLLACICTFYAHGMKTVVHLENGGASQTHNRRLSIEIVDNATSESDDSESEADTSTSESDDSESESDTETADSSDYEYNTADHLNSTNLFILNNIASEELTGIQLVEAMKYNYHNFESSSKYPHVTASYNKDLAKKITGLKNLNSTAKQLLRSVNQLPPVLLEGVREQTNHLWGHIFARIAESACTTIKTKGVRKIRPIENGKLLLLYNEKIELLDPKTGKTKKNFKVGKKVKNADFFKMKLTSNDKVVVHNKCGPKTLLDVWKLGNSDYSKVCKQPLKRIGQTIQQVTPIGNKLALLNCTSCDDGNNPTIEMLLLDTSSGKIINSFIPQGSFHKAGLYNEKTAVIVMKGEQPTALVYDTETGQRTNRILLNSSHTIISDGLFATLSGGPNQSTKVTYWDPASKDSVRTSVINSSLEDLLDPGKIIFQECGNGNVSLLVKDEEFLEHLVIKPENFEPKKFWFRSGFLENLVYSAKGHERELKETYKFCDSETIKDIHVGPNEEILISLSENNQLKRWILPPFKGLSLYQAFACAMLAQSELVDELEELSGLNILKIIPKCMRPEKLSNFWINVIKSLPQEIKNGLENDNPCINELDLLEDKD